MQPTPAVLLAESHGQRSQVGYSPWGRRESDKTERLTLSLYFQKERSIMERGGVDKKATYIFTKVETDKSELEKNLKFLKSIL